MAEKRTNLHYNKYSSGCANARKSILFSFSIENKIFNTIFEKEEFFVETRDWPSIVLRFRTNFDQIYVGKFGGNG